MPVPPAVSCASDRASAPRLATVQKRREVGHCFNVRKVARCFCRRQKCAYEGGMAIHRFFAAEKPRDGAAQGLPVSRRRQRHLLPFRVFCGRVFARCGIDKTGGFSLCVCVVWAGKVENSFSRGFIYGGSFPDSFDSAQPRGGRFAPSSKAFAPVPVRFAAGFLLVAELTKRTVFPVGNGGGVQNSRQKAKSWSKVWANCRNRAQNY